MQVAVDVIAVLAVLGTLTLVRNVVYQARRRVRPRQSEVTISVLIPARNERQNLPRLLEALAAQVRPAEEIIVCDDQSDDGTSDWLAENAERLGAQWFRADPRPPGWSGKNWACHLLAQRASREWLLFLDADTEPQPDLLTIVASVFADTSATLVTALPTLKPAGLGDGLAMATLPFAFFTFLLLQDMEGPRFPEFAFANGQLLGWRRRDCDELRPYEQVREAVVEDLALARLVKRRGGLVRVLDARGLLNVYMYTGTRSAVNGLARLALGSPYVALGFLCLGVVRPLGRLLPLVACASHVPWAWLPTLLLMLQFGLAAHMVGLPLWYGPLYPVAVVLEMWVRARALRWCLWRGVEWKGRTYEVPRNLP